jgi:pyrimidine operon attenuation protein/uracil phosphoribosyltransferase
MLTATVRRLAADVVPGGLATGVYYPSTHQRHAGHQLTQAVRNSKVADNHDQRFATRIRDAVLEAWPTDRIDAVVTVPPTNGKADRMAGLRYQTAHALRLHDGGAVLQQAFVVNGYRDMTIEQRRNTDTGRFVVTGDINHQTLLLVDDVVTSGMQAQQAIAALHAAGALTVRFVAIAEAAHATENATTRGNHADTAPATAPGTSRRDDAAGIT